MVSAAVGQRPNTFKASLFSCCPAASVLREAVESFYSPKLDMDETAADVHSVPLPAANTTNKSRSQFPIRDIIRFGAFEPWLAFQMQRR
jgi:hypothetical protein